MPPTRHGWPHRGQQHPRHNRVAATGTDTVTDTVTFAELAAGHYQLAEVLAVVALILAHIAAAIYLLRHGNAADFILLLVATALVALAIIVV